MSATVPIWFLAVYLVLTAVAPLTHYWWRRLGAWTLVLFAAGAIAVDVARFVFDVPGIAWANFGLVWAFVHQMGYWWSDRDHAGGLPRWSGWPLAAGALAALVAVTWIGWYPVAMVGIPGSEVTNMTPPTFAIAMLGVVQFGIISGPQAGVRRWTARPRAWHAVVSLGGVIMTVYLWHLSAMSLVAAAGLFTFGGAVFRLEPGTALWWATRPVWLAGLALVTLLLVAVFARFEWRISDAPPPATRRVVLVGMLLVAGSAAGAATFGITTRDAVVQWSIPVAAIAGAALLGALPARSKSAGRERSR
jgi:hypothetical protein